MDETTDARRARDQLFQQVAQILHPGVTADLQASLARLSEVDWKDAQLVEVLFDDERFELFVRGVRARIEGSEGFVDEVTGKLPLFSHARMSEIIDATESALAGIADEALRREAAPEVRFGVVDQVAAWLTAQWRFADGPPELPACIVLETGAAEQLVRDMRTHTWTSRFDFVSGVLR